MIGMSIAVRSRMRRRRWLSQDVSLDCLPHSWKPGDRKAPCHTCSRTQGTQLRLQAQYLRQKQNPPAISDAGNRFRPNSPGHLSGPEPLPRPGKNVVEFEHGHVATNSVALSGGRSEAARPSPGAWPRDGNQAGRYPSSRESMVLAVRQVISPACVAWAKVSGTGPGLCTNNSGRFRNPRMIQPQMVGDKVEDQFYST